MIVETIKDNLVLKCDKFSKDEIVSKWTHLSTMSERVDRKNFLKQKNLYSIDNPSYKSYRITLSSLIIILIIIGLIAFKFDGGNDKMGPLVELIVQVYGFFMITSAFFLYFFVLRLLKYKMYRKQVRFNKHDSISIVVNKRQFLFVSKANVTCAHELLKCINFEGTYNNFKNNSVHNEFKIHKALINDESALLCVIQ